MRKLERFQRGLAAILALVASSRMLYRTFLEPNPRLQSLGVILFRMAFIALIFFLIARRAVGKKTDPIAWAAFALLFAEGLEKATTARGFVIVAVCVGLAIVGGLIEHRLARAAQQAAFQRAPRPAIEDQGVG